jgi:Signal transduction histidine kinase
MNENDIIRKQLLKNMRYQFIAFALIFTMFGGLIFSQVRISLFSKLDGELFSAKQTFEQSAPRGVPNPQVGPGGQLPAGNAGIDRFHNPGVIPLLRDEQGNVRNFGSVNEGYYERYLKDIVFDKSSINTIVSLSVQGQYYFRGLTVPLKFEDGSSGYLQLLINADSEQSLLQHMTYWIAASILIFAVFSILASYILSQKTMGPVRAAWKKQTDFIENVSHELRTPLTVIQNSAETLSASPDQKIIEKSESLALILHETARLSKLVTDMLTLARSDSTMTDLAKVLFSPDRLIEVICEPYRELAENQHKSLNLQLDCPANLFADKDRFHQLMVILLDNALKYTDPGDSITVKTNFRDNKFLLSVSDTGIGIGDGAIDKIFDRFYREDRARAHDRNGTGLGLSIARWIVDKHGGSIKAQHNEPHGTIISIIIPK